MWRWVLMAGTLEPMPVYAYQAQVEILNVGEVLRPGRREAQGGARHRVEETVLHIGRGGLLDILEHPNPAGSAGQRIFVVRARGVPGPLSKGGSVTTRVPWAGLQSHNASARLFS
jgi:hypothetical protein